MRRAFTLIELLVTVGIMFILAGISMTNFQDAVIRARLSRVKAEFRNYEAAIEAYRVDNNHYPRMAHYTFYKDPLLDRVYGAPVNGIMSMALTTPVAYITSCNRLDPFMQSRKNAPLDEQFYTYQELSVYIERLPNSLFWKMAANYYGPWRLVSVGPDQVFDHRFLNSAQLIYDPTNGTVSTGNILRSPKSAGTGLPPIPDLLGYH